MVKIATIYKTESGTWKAQIRVQGKPSVTKTFRIKHDAQDWARATEDELRRGIYLPRSQPEKTTIKAALKRYLDEITPTKKESTRRAEKFRAKQLINEFGTYSLASLTPDVITRYRDKRLRLGKSNSTVRLELALLGHLYSTAIKDWQMGIAHNPVQSIRNPKPTAGRDRRLEGDVIWGKELQSDGYDILSALEPSQDGKFIAVGIVKGKKSDYDSLIVNFSSTGEELTQTPIVKPGRQFGRVIRPLGGNTVAIGGFDILGDSMQQQLWFFKTHLTY